MKQKHTGILTVGVTGGIGSGKSTVCRMFETLGAPVLYADDIAKEISHSNKSVQQSVVRLLGTGAYTAEGTLNREYVASRVFSNKKLQKGLNAIIHPEVERELEKRIAEEALRGARMVIVEAALIYEAGLDKRLDVVIVVDAPEKERLRRLTAADPTKDHDIRQRMKAQLHPSAKIRLADYVIYNSGSIQDLEGKVKFLYAIFERLRKDRN